MEVVQKPALRTRTLTGPCHYGPPTTSLSPGSNGRWLVWFLNRTVLVEGTREQTISCSFCGGEMLGGNEENRIVLILFYVLV